MAEPIVSSRDRFAHVPFTAGDGLGLSLHNFKSPKSRKKKVPVLLVHGAGVRSNIFSPPNDDTLPEQLSRAGYDVWTIDWRGSIETAPNQWTLDAAAVHDYPAAVAKIRELTGAATIKAVIHCQGSTSFMMSIAAGLLPDVDTVVSNAVALHTLVPPMAWWKAMLATNTIGATVDYVNPQWGLYVTGFWPRVIDLWVRMTHHECRNAVCKHASFTYGSGFPTLWLHENLSDDTHEWLKGEFAHVPMSFFRQMRKMHRQGQSRLDRKIRPAAGRFLRSGAEDGRALRLPRRPAQCMLHLRRHGAHLRLFRTLRARQARLPGARRLRPSRRVHRQGRPSRRLSLDRRRAREGLSMGPPGRQKRLEGRHAYVDGIRYVMPVDAAEASATIAVFPCDYEAARALIPPGDVHPFRLWSKALLVLTVIDYRKTDIGRYIEYSLAIACTKGPKPAPRLLPALLVDRYGTGQYVVDLPVSSEVSVKGGKGIWGMPKHKAALDYREGKKWISAQYDLDGQMVTRLDVQTARQRLAPDQHGRRQLLRVPRHDLPLLHLFPRQGRDPAVPARRRPPAPRRQPARRLAARPELRARTPCSPPICPRSKACSTIISTAGS